MTVQTGELLTLPRARTVPEAVRSSVLFAADLATILLASTLAFLLHMVVQDPPILRAIERAETYGLAWHGWGTLLMLALLLTYFGARGHYTSRVPFWLELRGIVIGATVGFLGDSFIRVSVFAAPYGFESAIRWLLLVPSLLVMRQAARGALRQFGFWSLRTLVIGEPSAIDDARAALTSEPALGYDVVATMNLGAAAAWPERSLAGVLADCGAEFAVLVIGSSNARLEQQMVASLARARLPYAIVPALDGIPVTGFSSHYFLTHDVVLLVRDNRLTLPVSRMVKTVFDQIVAAICLLLLAPLFLVVAAMIRADGGPAFFGHRRIGADGGSFRCLKFRTMVTDAEQVLQELLLTDPNARAEWAATQKLRNDPRVTRIGAFLRKTSLDELPQLINVLRGDMSLVGPRPIVESELAHYGRDLSYYYEAKPGITGLWQVSGRSDTSYAYRVKLDVWYVRNWTLWHDLTILMKTIPAVFLRRGAL